MILILKEELYPHTTGIKQLVQLVGQCGQNLLDPLC